LPTSCSATQPERLEPLARPAERRRETPRRSLWLSGREERIPSLEAFEGSKNDPTARFQSGAFPFRLRKLRLCEGRRPEETEAGERRVRSSTRSGGSWAPAFRSESSGRRRAGGLPDASTGRRGRCRRERRAPHQAEAVVRVGRPTAQAAELASGTVLIGFLSPLRPAASAPRGARRRRLRDGVIPRITRAVHGRALLAGERGGLQGGADRSGSTAEVLPLLMTAAGRCSRQGARARRRRRRAARSQRLAARRGHHRIRRAAGRQNRSRASADLPRPGSGARRRRRLRPRALGREQGRQQDALTEQIPAFDTVITTALIPGRPAPKLFRRVRCVGCDKDR
jgi:NAD(P) transhydrogenase subunit alpha